MTTTQDSCLDAWHWCLNTQGLWYLDASCVSEGLDAWCKPPIRTCVWLELVNLDPAVIYINQHKYCWNSEATVIISDCPTRKKMIVPETRRGAVVFHGRACKTESESLAPTWISTASSTQGCQGHSLPLCKVYPSPVYIMCVRIYTGCEYLLSANIY